jgi:peptidoglycan/LPS O-acetylase OafA/YrhL
VDFFFMLSGFVLTRSYEAKLRTSLTLWRFVQIRVIRLYPLFALGVLFGTVAIAGQIHFHNPHALKPAHALIAFAMNILMLPSVVSPDLFPLNGPGWSLFLELVLNILMAAILFRLPSRALMLVCALGGAGLCYWAFRLGAVQFGADWGTLIAALFRVSFSFPAGILLARSHGRKTRSISSFSLLVVAALVVALAAGLPGLDWLYDSLVILLAMPVILWLGTVTELPRGLHRMAAVLGDVSYPLYAVHLPLLKMFAYIFVSRMHLPAGAMTVIFGIGIFGFAWLLALYYDAPLRKWLSGRLHVKPTALPQE